MSLEESIQLLTNEIKQLRSILELNNEIIQKKINSEIPLHIKKRLSEREAAEYIGMSRSFLAKDRMNGPRKNRTKGPNAIKIGRRIMYDIDELNKWLKIDTRC